MKGKTTNVFHVCHSWDMSSWFNWYWWLPDDSADTEEDKIDSKETSPIDDTIPDEEPKIDSLDEEIFPKEETITKEVAPEEKPKPKRKRRTVSKKVSTKSQDAIELVLRPTILEELEKEAIISDSTINQVIQIILEAHIESKDSANIQTEVWKCNFCKPKKEFLDYFKFSDHFFKEHMQPGLKKISEFNNKE